MDKILADVTGLLGVAILVAIVARRLRLPYTVGLVLAGIGLAAAQFKTDAVLTHDFIFDLILPPLLFEATLSLSWRDIVRDWPPILALSTIGVALSAALFALGLIAVLDWPLAPALVFGVLIAATDPIAVIAMFRDAGVKGRLALLIESESLVNDGVAAVLFALALAWVQANRDGAAAQTAFALTLLGVVGGGVAVGLVAGAAAIVIAGRTNDPLVETALTAVAAYGSFLAAERFHMSGVLACVAAGVLMGNLGILRHEAQAFSLSAGGRQFVVAFWDFAAFIANSFVFLMMGLSIGAMPFATLGAFALGVAIALSLLARALAVYPLCWLFARTRWAVSPGQRHMLWWGGLRGALALALALALPQTLPFRAEIQIAAFGVVAFSVVVQGLTMPMIMRWLGAASPDA